MPVSLVRNNLSDNTPSRLAERIVIAFRLVFFLLVVLTIDAVSDIGTSPWTLALSGGVGIIAATRLAQSILNWRGFLLLLLGVVAVVKLSSLVLTGINLFVNPLVMWSVPVIGHTEVAAAALIIGAATTWFFWRARAAITVEVILAASTIIYLMSGHRGLHLERPRMINSIAWSMGVDPLTLFLSTGVIILLTLTTYLVIASRVVRPALTDRTIRNNWSGENIFGVSAIFALIAALLYGVTSILSTHYRTELQTLTSNGVGQGSKEGASPLGFHSALGSSNQPAALVRLDGDYKENPFSPMLYMRESALSDFNGHEMVFAGKAYDNDITATPPSQTYTGKEDENLSERTPVQQSIYLLADSQDTFGIDYPLSIAPLKNPNSTRFRGAFKVYSVAPTYKLSELTNAEAGDPRWSPEVQAHYVVKHQNPAYAELAHKVTDGEQTAAGKAFAITNYLSRTAIYTLTPGHEVGPNDDPVAPFLFGDHRGYCVHFAHAIVYMLRGLGIPSRVATGYLTDLSQAKDGHILLRMSDRHAWAEAYFAGFGWVPLDVQPDKVESHAETQVDMKMLEDLMGMLEPGDEILPPEDVKDEPGMENSTAWEPPPQSILAILGGALFLIIGAKLWLRYSWMVPAKPRLLGRRYYRACSSRLFDAGISRNLGETYTEFEARLETSHALSLGGFSGELSSGYSPAHMPDRAALKKAYIDCSSSLRSLPLWRKLLIAINPASVFAWIKGDL